MHGSKIWYIFNRWKHMEAICVDNNNFGNDIFDTWKQSIYMWKQYMWKQYVWITILLTMIYSIHGGNISGSNTC